MYYVNVVSERLTILKWRIHELMSILVEKEQDVKTVVKGSTHIYVNYRRWVDKDFTTII